MKFVFPICASLLLGACGLSILAQALRGADRAYISLPSPIIEGQDVREPILYKLAIIERRDGAAARFEGAINGKLPMPILNSRTNALSGPIVENPDGTAVRAEFQRRLSTDRDGSKSCLSGTFNRFGSFFRGINRKPAWRRSQPVI